MESLTANRDRVFFELTNDAAFTATIDQQGKVVLDSVSEGFVAVTGYTAEDLKAEGGWPVLVHPDDLPAAKEKQEELISGQQLTGEFRINARDGEVRWIRYRVLPFRNQGENRVEKIFGTFQDFTEERQADEALRKSSKRIINILENITDAFFAIDREGCFTYLNSRAEQLLRRKREELLGQNIWQMFPEAIGSAFFHNYNHTLTTGIATDFEEFYPPFETWFHVHASPSRDGIAVYFRDISQRKQAEQELKQRNRELGTLNAITAAVSSTLELPKVIATLEKFLVANLEIPGGAVFIYNELADYFSLQAHWGLPDAFLVGCKSFPARLVRGRTKASGGSGSNSVPEPREIMAKKAQVAGWQGYRYIPLLAKENPQGFLCLFGKTPEAFRAADGAFFSILGQQVGMAISNARMFEQMSAGRKRLQMLSGQLVQVQEAERRHIARELHDEINQTLTGLKLVLEMAPRLQTAQANRSLTEARDLVNQLVIQVRTLSLDLRPAMLDDLGLLPALLWHLDRYSLRTKVDVKFEHQGLQRRFSQEIETAAYRIVQEALTNVARHAGVNGVKVQVWADEVVLGIRVHDKGIGFDPEAKLAAGQTCGLSGIKERAGLLGGHITVESHSGAGTCLMAELPLEMAQQRSIDELDDLAG